MNRDQKTAVVDEIAGEIQGADAIFAVDYRGITVSQVADLRIKLRDADARFRVVKNSLSERAADQAGLDSLKPMLVGPTALAFVNGDAALAAKALNDAARQFNLLEFKGGVLNGATLTADDVRSIARLPAREVLYAQLVGTVAAPLTGLARGLNALIGGLAIQLQAIADQGLVTGSPAAPPAGDAAEAAAEEQAQALETAPGDTAPAAEEPPAGPPDPEPNTPEAEAETARAADEPETQAASDATTSDE
ncbi:MAG TPA: 50S ribosomal protein L10 [Solirubrobacteraceae bacterium]|jgi:large subunit ribosomal protein L10